MLALPDRWRQGASMSTALKLNLEAEYRCLDGKESQVTQWLSTNLLIMTFSRGVRIEASHPES